MTIERGTTQELKITIKGWDLTNSDVFVTLQQGIKSLTTSALDSVTYANSKTTILLTLSQKQTIMFKEGQPGLIQVRWIGSDGYARKTKTAPFNVDKLLYEAVLTKDAHGDE